VIPPERASSHQPKLSVSLSAVRHRRKGYGQRFLRVTDRLKHSGISIVLSSK
jgi:hypothetical protein